MSGCETYNHNSICLSSVCMEPSRLLFCEGTTVITKLPRKTTLNHFYTWMNGMGNTQLCNAVCEASGRSEGSSSQHWARQQTIPQWGPSHQGEALAAHPHRNTAINVNRPRFLQDGQDGTEVLRPALTRRGRHDGRGRPGAARDSWNTIPSRHTPSLADFHCPWQTSSI